jgi:peptidyl-prolyl cis-trans isomerase D
MLSFIRRYKNAFMILFVISVLGLVLSFGIPGMGAGEAGGGASLASKPIARVASQKVTVREFHEDLSRREEQLRRAFGSQLNSEQGKQFFEQIRKAQINPERILEELLQRKIFLHMFEEQRMEIADSAVRYQIQELPYFQKEGKFDAELYRRMVTLPAQFEDSLRNQLKAEKVMEPLAFLSLMLSEGEVSLENKLAQKKEFELLTITPDVIKKEASVTEAEALLLANDATKETELQNLYNRNIKNFKKDEEVSARHILIKEEDGGEAKAKEVLAEIKAGKISFVEAAKVHSKDFSNASKGGELGFFGKNVMDKAFEEAAFALKNKGDLSEVVKTAFGFHLIELVDRKEAVNVAFADVKVDLAKDYLKEKKKLEALKALVSSWMTSKTGPTAAQLKAHGLSWTKASDWDVGQVRLGSLGEKDVTPQELAALGKAQPLLPRIVESTNSLTLVRWVADKTTPVKFEEMAYQKSLRMTDLYFQRYRKNLEQEKKIERSDKLLAQVVKSMNL